MIELNLSDAESIMIWGSLSFYLVCSGIAVLIKARRKEK